MPGGGEASGFGFAELRGGGTRVVIVPALGARIVAMEMGGRQWLWTSPSLAPSTATDDSSYLATGDTGGFDECFPTVAACRLPIAAGKFAGVDMPERGELWAQRAQMEIETGGDAMEATAIWHGQRMPYRMSRSVRVDGDGVVEMRYAAENEGNQPIPFIWAAQPVFPLGSKTRLILPEGSGVRVHTEHRIALGGRSAEHRWPHARLAKRIADLSKPAAVARRYACKLFVEPRGSVALEEGDARLDLEYDPRSVTELGIWIDHRGFGKLARRSRSVLSIQPGLGAPDSLSDALESWKRAQWLQPGEKREWALRWRAKGPGVGGGGDDADVGLSAGSGAVAGAWRGRGRGRGAGGTEGG